MEKQIIIPGEPMGKERPRTFMQHGMVLTYTPDKTRNYETLTRTIFKKKYGKELFPSREKPISVKITAVFQLPKRSKYEFPVKKPDADNIAKIVCDALNGLAWYDDAQITSLSVTKEWGADPMVKVEWEVQE